MRYWPAAGHRLERYEVDDGGIKLGIANEEGDITAYVERPDGSRGHSYGGPVYDPPEFANVCGRESEYLGPDWQCSHTTDMTAAERATADAFARKVGWMS